MIRQTILKRSRLRNLANKTQNPTGIINFKKHQNIATKLNKEIKRSYLITLNPKPDCRHFWERSKPHFPKRDNAV